MSASWNDDDEDFKIGVRVDLKTRPRFSFTELKMLLDAVKRNRYIILKKFNQGVAAESKRATWAEITNEINALGENHREVRQIMKKWADLKCDGKRRIVALRGPNGKSVRKKRLGPVEQMVHEILMMSPKGDSEDQALSKLYGPGRGAESEPSSYTSLTEPSLSGDYSPPSSPEKEPGGEFQSSDYEMPDDGERAMDFEDDASLFSSSCSDQPPPPPPPRPRPSPRNTAPPTKLLQTYSRTKSRSRPSSSSPPASPRPSNGIPTSSYSSSTSFSSAALTHSWAPPTSTTTTAPSSTPTLAPPTPPITATNSAPSSSSSSRQPSSPPPPSCSSSSSSSTTSSTSASWKPTDPLPSGPLSGRAREQLAQVAQQSLQQQQASRALLAGVSRSLETLAQSLQQLVETQQEFVHESLLLQREALAVLRDFSGSALAVLRDKGGGGAGGGAPPRGHAAPRF